MMKPIVFDIYCGGSEANDTILFHESDGDLPPKGNWIVVEKSAYDKAIAALKEISQNISAFNAELVSPSDMALNALKELGEQE